MTKKQEKLLKNIGLLICSLSQVKVNQMECNIINNLCDGPDSTRARSSGVEQKQIRLKKYQALIEETHKLSSEKSSQ
jgi:hypothetical protein